MNKTLKLITAQRPSKQPKGRPMRREATRQRLARKKWRWNETDSREETPSYITHYVEGRKMSIQDHFLIFYIHLSVCILSRWASLFVVCVFSLSSSCVIVLCFTLFKVGILNKKEIMLQLTQYRLM